MSRKDIINRLKELQAHTAAEREDYIANILHTYPNIDICIGRLPSQEEIQALERCPLYDGILIIFNQNREQEDINNER